MQVQKQTGRVVQVGTQQRDEFDVHTHPTDLKEKPEVLFQRQFLLAVALARHRPTGRNQKCQSRAPWKSDKPGVPKVDVPDGLKLGNVAGPSAIDRLHSGTNAQSTNKAYPASRCHYEFRWWYEYSGGKLTDWAHITSISHSGLWRWITAARSA